jgi:cobalt-zinc-cadmium resistance protein CzcA
MSLGAIDFGLLVDGAVVLVERVFHDLAHHPDLTRAERLARVRAACQHVARPMFSSVVVIMMVYVPVLTMTGVDGKLFRPMAITVVLALATALLAALTLVPALAALVLNKQAIPAEPPRLVRALERVYAAMLPWLTRLRAPIGVAAVAAIALAGVLFARAGSELTPQLDEGDLVIQTTRRPDLSLDAAIAAAGRMEATLREVPEVRQVVSRIGSPAVATDVMGVEQADVFVGLLPRERWRPGLTRDALIAELHDRIERVTPGSDPSFTQPIQMRFNELLAGAATDVVISVYGDDLPTLHHLADALRAAVAGEPGVVDARVLAPDDVPLLEVRPRPLDLTQRGLAVGDVLDAVQAIRFGLPVATTYDGPRVIPIVLSLGGLGANAGAAALGDLLIPTPGAPIPLGALADLDQHPTPGMVQHEGGQRRLVLGFNVRGVDLGHAVAGAQRRAASVVIPRGYELRWGGQLETLEAAHRRLRIVVPLVLLLITGILALTFRAVRHTIIILTHVPFACVGGVAALAVRGLPVSMSAAIGFIALSGIAVMNGVVLLSQVRAGEEAGMTPAEAVLAAAKERARPVMMTALVAMLGFVPMMLASGVGAEVQRPLATVVVGGLLTSTMLTLGVLPALYPWLVGRRRR